MSGEGAPQYVRADGSELRIGVVAAQWHERVMEGLMQGALRGLTEARVPSPTVVRVPGAFELPVMALHLSRIGYDAIVALGVVIRGGTPHFEYVCRSVTDGLTRVAIDSGVPVGFGVLTCDTEAQALARAGLPGSEEDKGHVAAQAAVITAAQIHSLLKLD